MNEKEKAMNDSEVKKCPKCGGEMEIGYLNNAPYWRRGKSLWQVGFGPRIYGFTCKKCGYVEFYLEKKEGVETRMSKV